MDLCGAGVTAMMVPKKLLLATNEHFKAGYQPPPANNNKSLWMLFYGSLVYEQEVAMEVVCTNIDNNLLLGSCPRAPTYQPAAELSGAQFEIASGIMQVAEGKDMETAFSYFKEAATGFVSRKQRARALKYMLLSKIMMNRNVCLLTSFFLRPPASYHALSRQ
ncbi:putative 26S proteasome regulatory subunit rpn-6.1 [Portunus trituberculatus]|uniref:Putative 26S proteasome regulatory subunit rpn-6.1 n=1 Tax=Portunus trituberculatus TaxID=210409 RepID=A0A5B7D1V1_PORTR|nr:putative 26S proteasome regulatory subunit rpn-6.1 [Portunus trituberculatus]